MAKNIYQIQVALRGSKPKIWRRLLIQPDLLLKDLHKIIQTSMGWTNSHLHQFIKNGIYYQHRYPENDLWNDSHDKDYEKIKISDLLKNEKEKIIYEYDFGDSWDHDIVLEKILPVDESLKYPVCIKGKMHCPPEDVGGMGGYENMLEILKDPSNDEFESYKEWLGGGFDPAEFDISSVNFRLSSKDFGCEEIED